ncbi:hypothetical protein [Kribbella rubisoli]|uniref:hypothetical protein n=1 Tax=Kribbella rubisoli TaxID=3075929 RepID=UPI00102BC99A|nr:hypothetical protein [Kribbella rubisoli]
MTNPLVEREWLTGDELTEAGERALAALNTTVQAQRRKITTGISDEEYLATVGVLKRMADNLG